MKFSIILPIYNVEKYLRPCVESILEQSLQDFEMILVDDGSTDKSPFICDEYSEKYENVTVRHQTNGGLSEARNAGLRLSKGEYIFFIDSDDYLINNNVLEKLAKAVEADDYPDVVVFKSIKWFESNGKFSSSTINLSLPRYKTGFIDTCLQLCNKSSFENQAWTRIVKRSVLIDNNIEFEKGLISEDIDWNYTFVLCAKTIALVDEVLYVYRQRAGSITHTGNMKSLESNLWILNKWTTLAKSSKNDAYVVIENDLARIFCNMIILYCGVKGGRVYYKKIESYSYLLKIGNNSRVKKFRIIKRCVGFSGLLILIKIARWMKR